MWISHHGAIISVDTEAGSDKAIHSGILMKLNLLRGEREKRGGAEGRGGFYGNKMFSVSSLVLDFNRVESKMLGKRKVYDMKANKEMYINCE